MVRDLIYKYRKMGQEAKAGLWFVICNFLQKGISFISIPMFTRVLSTEEYGITSLYNTWSTLLIIFATLNLSGGVYNRGLLEFEELKYTSAVQSIAAISSSMVALIVFLFHNWFSTVSGLDNKILLFMCIHFYVAAGLNLWTVKQRFNYRYKLLVIVTLLNSIISTGLGLIAAIYSSGNKGTDKVVWSCIGLIIVALPFYFYNFYKGKTFYNREMWKYSLSFNLPLIPHYLSNLILNQSDRIMINMFCGTSSVAFYSVAYSLSSIVRIFTEALNQTLNPWRYQMMKRKRYSDINRISILMLAIVGSIIFLANLFAPEIIYFFGDKRYSEAVYVVPPVMLSVFFIFMYNMFSNIEFYFLKTKFMMIASSASAILNIILNYIFISLFGYVACAYTSLICYCLYALFHYIYMKSICKKEIGNVEIFNLRTLILSSAIVMISTFLSVLLYGYFSIRLILFIIAIVIVFRYRKMLINIFAVELKR